MRRAVITGIGIVSSIGDNKEEVLDSLKEGHSGITFAEEYAEMGFRSHVYGIPSMNLDEVLDRKLRRFMGDGAGYNYIAMLEAIQDSKLKELEILYKQRIRLVREGQEKLVHLWCHEQCRVQTQLPWRHLSK